MNENAQDNSLMFMYRYADAEQYTIKTENYQTVKENDKIISRNIFLENHISVTITKPKNALFDIVQNTEFTEDGHLRREENSKYQQNSLGIMTISPQYMTPAVRNVPTFLPQKIISVNEKWVGSGTDTIFIPFFKSFEKIPIKVLYEYKGSKTLPQTAKEFIKRKFKNVDDISNALSLIEARYNINNYTVRNFKKDDSWNIDAEFVLSIWWNNNYGRTEFFSEDYKITFISNNSFQAKKKYEFSGNSLGYMAAVKTLDTLTIVKQLQEEINEKSIDVSVEASDKGVQFTLDNIQFDPDSAILMDEEKEKLNELIRILKKYPHRRVLIEGHTALAGVEKYRKPLSILRAKTVKEYIENVLNDGREILFQGHGSDEPRATNNTIAGRKQNRRVEITILEN